MKQEKENFESEDEDLSSLIEVEESPEDKSHHPSGEKSSSSSPSTHPGREATPHHHP